MSLWDPQPYRHCGKNNRNQLRNKIGDERIAAYIRYFFCYNVYWKYHLDILVQLLRCIFFNYPFQKHYVTLIHKQESPTNPLYKYLKNDLFSVLGIKFICQIYSLFTCYQADFTDFHFTQISSVLQSLVITRHEFFLENVQRNIFCHQISYRLEKNLSFKFLNSENVDSISHLYHKQTIQSHEKNL